MKSRDHTQTSLDRCVLAGGLPALRKAYPWHPSFPETEDKDIERQLTVDYQKYIEKGALANKASVTAAPEEGGGAAAGGEGNTPGSGTNGGGENGADGGDKEKSSVSMTSNQGTNMSSLVSQSLVI